MNTEFALLTDEEVVAYASKNSGSQKSFMATDELTRRALADHRLMNVALEIISSDRATKPRYVPYGCYLSVPRILNSGDKHAIQCLLERMNVWSSYEQVDAIRAWSGQKRLAEATQELRAAYGWLPKYTLDM